MKLQLLLLVAVLTSSSFADEGEVPDNGLPSYCGFRTSKLRVTGDFLAEAFNGAENWTPGGPAVLEPSQYLGDQCVQLIAISNLTPLKTYSWKVTARADWGVGNWGCAQYFGQASYDGKDCQFVADDSGQATLNFMTLGDQSNYTAWVGSQSEGQVVDNGLPSSCGLTSSRVRVTGSWVLSSQFNTPDWDPAGPAMLVAQTSAGEECLYSLTVYGLPSNNTYDWKVTEKGNWNVGNWGCDPSGVNLNSNTNCVFTVPANGSVTLNIKTSGDRVNYQPFVGQAVIDPATSSTEDTTASSTEDTTTSTDATTSTAASTTTSSTTSRSTTTSSTTSRSTTTTSRSTTTTSRSTTTTSSFQTPFANVTTTPDLSNSASAVSVAAGLAIFIMLSVL